MQEECQNAVALPPKKKEMLIMETIKKVFLHFDVPKELLLWYILYGTWQAQSLVVFFFLFVPFVLL